MEVEPEEEEIIDAVFGGDKKHVPVQHIKSKEANVISSLQLDSVFDCGNLKKFAKTVREILLFRGYSESKFFICEFGPTKLKLLVKMAFYKKTIPELYMGVVKERTQNPSEEKKTKFLRIPPHDAEIATLELFHKKIIEKNISPCIVELLYYKKCNSAMLPTPKTSTCHQYITGSKQEESVIDSLNMIFCNYAELIRNDLAFDKFNYLVLERCDVTFHEYLTRLRPKSSISFEQFRSFMFQIIYTIYRIKKLYPSFRHGDLHSENIMIKYDKEYYFNPLKPKFYKFYVDGEPRYVPYFGIVCKIIDFGFTVIEEENIKSSIVGDKFIMFRRTKNDLLFLLSDIWNIQGDNKMIVDFLALLEPNGTYFHFNTDYISHIEKHIPTYEDMIKNKVFDIYKEMLPSEDQIVHEFAQ